MVEETKEFTYTYQDVTFDIVTNEDTISVGLVGYWVTIGPTCGGKLQHVNKDDVCCTRINEIDVDRAVQHACRILLDARHNKALIRRFIGENE